MSIDQIDGLPMGSPLSGAWANLFMENLEADHFLGIVGSHAPWIRYADDVTILISVRVITDELAARLNAVHAYTSHGKKNETVSFPSLMSWSNATQTMNPHSPCIVSQHARMITYTISQPIARG